MLIPTEVLLSNCSRSVCLRSVDSICARGMPFPFSRSTSLAPDSVTALDGRLLSETYVSDRSPSASAGQYSEKLFAYAGFEIERSPMSLDSVVRPRLR